MTYIPLCSVIVGAVAQFKDVVYSVIENDASFIVVIEKVGATKSSLDLFIDFIPGSAMSKDSLCILMTTSVPYIETFCSKISFWTNIMI